MSTQSPPRGLAVGLIAAALGAGIVVGRWAHAPAAEPSHAVAAIEAKPVIAATSSDATRFKIPVTRSQPSQGSGDALVTIVEWCDLQGEPCAQSNAVIERVRAAHPDQVRRVYRHFSRAEKAAQVPHEFAHLAHEQAGKFWETRAWMMALDHEPSRAEIDSFAAQLGLDVEATKKSLDRHGPLGHIVADRAFAEMFDVADAPAVFVNGRRIPAPAGKAPTFESLTRVVDEELKAAQGLVQSGIAPEHVYAELTKDGVWRSRRNSSQAR